MPPQSDDPLVALSRSAAAAQEILAAAPPGGMCQYKVRLASPEEVDAELIAWIRAAYNAAG